MKLRKVLLTGILVLLVTVVLAIPVSAAPPTVATWDEATDWEVSGSLCPGYVLRDYEMATIRVTTYYDNDGNILQLQVHVSGTDNFYLAENPGVVLTGSFAGKYMLDPNTGEGYYIGLPWHINVPGYGTVLLRAGRWAGFQLIHLAGKDSFDSLSDIAQLCAYLAGN